MKNYGELRDRGKPRATLQSSPFRSSQIKSLLGLAVFEEETKQFERVEPRVFVGQGKELENALNTIVAVETWNHHRRMLRH